MLFCVWFCSRCFGSGSRVFCVLSEVQILPKASGAAVKHERAIKTRQPRAAQADSQCAPHYSMAAEARLRQERTNWRKDHPPFFIAKPKAKADGSADLFNWCACSRKVGMAPPTPS